MNSAAINLNEWVGRRDIKEDVISPWPIKGLSATFDLSAPDLSIGSEIPLGWHWLYFLEAASASELGVDGHPKRGGFLPPIELPRRMWAGGRIQFNRALRIGEVAKKESEIISLESKSGRSGEMVFVVVRHTIYGSNEVVLVEEQDIVYRGAAKPGDVQAVGKPAEKPAKWQRSVNANSTLLFRYSALTFNGHRIHYDLPYATKEECYPELVVHGPLQAMLLLGECQRHMNKPLSKFRYRGVAPLFQPQVFTVNSLEIESGKLELWTADSQNRQCMTATAEI